MFLFNFLNRTETDPYAPLYEILYIIECLFLIADLIICPTVAYALLSTTALHLNTRLIIACGIPVGFLAGVARIPIIHYQYYGDVFVSDLALIMSSLCRAQFMSYFCGILPLIAIDRLVATTHWRWYESQSRSTICIFLVSEGILVTYSFAQAYVTIYATSSSIPDIAFPVTLLTLALIGGVLFVPVYMFNIREVDLQKKGAQINRYSVARSYQFRENVAITKFFFRLSMPILLCAMPAFSFYMLKIILKRIGNCNWLRIFAAEMFDFGLGITMVVVAPGVVIYEPRVKQSLRKLRIFNKVLFYNTKTPAKPKKFITHEADSSIYFSMLSRDLNGV